MGKYITLTIILLTISVVLFSKNRPKIEVYLVNMTSFVDTTENKTGQYFDCLESDIPDSSFLTDNDIIGYEIRRNSSEQNDRKNFYYIRLNTSGKNKLSELKNILLCCGTRFVLTVDRKPIFGGYFWNPLSSFGCAWLTIPILNSERIEILRGLPYEYFTNKHNDPRGDKRLIEAFQITERLIEN